MPGFRTLNSSTGLSAGDHASWGYSSRRDLMSAVIATLEEGVRRGERVMYVGEGTADSLREDLVDLPGRDRLITSGGLVVLPVAELYDSLSAATRESAEAQAARLRTAAETAVADGYTGLRIVGDVTALAQGAEDAARLTAYELAVDGLLAHAPVTALCAYDERIVDSWAGALAAVHPLQHRSSTPAMFCVTLRGGTLTLSGEVDSICARDLQRVLDVVLATTTGPLVVDLAPLDFIDVAGSRVLARAGARMVESGRDLDVLGAKVAARRCLALFGLDAAGATP